MTDEAPTKDSSVPTAPVVNEQRSAASTPSLTEVTPLTIGEMVEKHLNTHRIGKTSKKETACFRHKCLRVIMNLTPFCKNIFLVSLSVCLKSQTLFSPRVGSLLNPLYEVVQYSHM